MIDPIAEAVAAERSLLTSGETSERTTDPSNDYRVKAPANCYACGDYHGSVNQAFLCMQLALRDARKRLLAVRAIVDPNCTDVAITHKAGT